VGEGGAIIGPPTLFNAIADALSPFGEVPISLPLTPDRILDVIEGRAVSPAPSSRFAAPVSDDGAAEPTTEAPGISAALAGVDPEDVVEPDAGGPATVDGQWKVTMIPPMGPQQEMTATFVTNGDALTGKLDSDQGAQDFAGSVDGNRLKWEMKVTAPMSMTLKYDLTVDGNALSGKCKLGILGSAKVTGQRI
jgi:aerobic carbon-monoxide dehydrogenase large subunit